MNQAWKKWFRSKTKEELIDIAWELHLENKRRANLIDMLMEDN